MAINAQTLSALMKANLDKAMGTSEVSDESRQKFCDAIAGALAALEISGNGLTTIQVECDGSVEVGHLVYASGNGAVNVSYCDRIDTMPAFGVVVSKIDATHAVVQFSGVVVGVYTNLTPGYQYVAGHQGRPVSFDEVSLGFLQPIGIALTPSQLMLVLSQQMVKLYG